MSALSNPENIHQVDETIGVISELPTEQTIAWRLAQETPEYARSVEVPEKIRFMAAQIGMLAAEDWRVRAEWTTVYLKAVGPSHDY